MAEVLYGTFCRNPATPEARGLGIPIFWAVDPRRSIPVTGRERASYVAVVLLIDDQMVVDPSWEPFYERLIPSAAGESCVVILPVALSRSAFQLHPALSGLNLNYTRLFEHGLPEERETVLKRELAHAFCRLLALAPGTKFLEEPTQSIQVFLSHAKLDGELFATRMRDWLRANSGLDSFFDASDIPPGTDFGRILEKEVRHAAFLALQSDVYSSRVWCRRELLFAKRYQVPILIVNALEKGEARSFPYSGNSPTMRWAGDMAPIVEKLLLEVLLYRYFNGLIKSMAHLRPELDNGQYWVFPRPPELLTLQQVLPPDQPNATAIYPDPTLTKEELEILRRDHPDCRLLTPIRTHPETSAETSEPVKRSLIAFSVSEAEDWNALGLDRLHQDDAFVELSRYLLVSGANLAYGGDLRRGGYTEILWQLVQSYRDQETNVFPMRHYQAWPISLSMDVSQQARLKSVLQSLPVGLPDEVRTRFGLDPENNLAPTGTEALYIWGRCLTAMRERMSREADARILIGGRLTGFKGRYPGLIEEACLTLREKKPLFLAGGFGGCAQALVAWMQGSPENALRFRGQPEYRSLEDFYGKEVEAGKCPRTAAIDFDELDATLVDPSATISKRLNNGLSQEDNELLFKTRDLPLMVHLVLKGLGSLNLV
ncbi:MAG: TIR domain-containing protein [Verrucomicrobia bacterium]|nr:TIR domain-containing protein [Verrucomicrobiota bacterium]